VCRYGVGAGVGLGVSARLGDEARYLKEGCAGVGAGVGVAQGLE
jgi:hypothetical protein